MIDLYQKARDEELRKEYEAGATIAELAERFKINKTTVRNAILRAGGKMRPMGYRRDWLPQQLAERNAIFRKEYETGKSAGQISIKYRIHHSTVERAIVKAGGTLRPRGRYRKA